MANRLEMATVDSILRLPAQGRSQRQIAVDLQVDRKAVSRYVRLAKRDDPVSCGTEETCIYDEGVDNCIWEAEGDDPGWYCPTEVDLNEPVPDERTPWKPAGICCPDIV